MPDTSCNLNNKITIVPARNAKVAAPFNLVRQNIRKAAAIISLLGVDAGALIICIALGFRIRSDVLPSILPIFPSVSPPQLGDKTWWIFAIVILCLIYEGLYTKRLSFWQETRKIVNAVTLAFIVIFAIVSLAKLSGEISRTVLVFSYFLLLFMLPLGRYLGKYVLGKAGLWNEPVLILGSGTIGKKVAKAMAEDHYQGYEVKGFLKSDTVKESDEIVICGRRYPMLGEFKDAAQVICSTGVRKIIIAAPELPGSELVSLTNQLQRYTRSILIVPDLFGIPALSSETDCFFQEQILALNTRNNLASWTNIVTKYIFEVLGGALAFILLIPIMLVIAAAIKIDSSGPIGYSHRRVGKNGKEFNCYKFRTMAVNADEMLEKMLAEDECLREEWERSFKLKNDPRVTRIGKILRKSSLDELPQIINVIKGEMSLVGPRPIVQEEVARFGDYAKDCLMVRPGMTGLWATSGRSDMEYEERAQMEAWYVHNWSLWLDISILFKTIASVFRMKGAY